MVRSWQSSGGGFSSGALEGDGIGGGIYGGQTRPSRREGRRSRLRLRLARAMDFSVSDWWVERMVQPGALIQSS